MTHDLLLDCMGPFSDTRIRRGQLGPVGKDDRHDAGCLHRGCARGGTTGWSLQPRRKLRRPAFHLRPTWDPARRFPHSGLRFRSAGAAGAAERARRARSRWLGSAGRAEDDCLYRGRRQLAGPEQDLRRSHGRGPAGARRGSGAGAALRLSHRNRRRRRATQERDLMNFASTAITADPAATVADAVRLRPFEPGDLPAAHAMSSALKWPHRIEDWQFALSLGQGVVAERDGKVLGTALSWQWGTNHATLGLVIVSPELQGQRIGNRMMEALLDPLATRNVLLHATVAGRGLYERLGFSTTGEVAQHQGVLAALPALEEVHGNS